MRGKFYTALTRVDDHTMILGYRVCTKVQGLDEHATLHDELREKGGMMRVKRLNRFRIRVYGEQDALRNICYMSAVLWNKLNYVRRQSFFKGCFEWKAGVKELYNSFKMILGSAITLEVIRKNDEAWRSFFKLKRMLRENKLPPNIKRVGPPGYWKDKKSGKRS